MCVRLEIRRHDKIIKRTRGKEQKKGNGKKLYVIATVSMQSVNLNLDISRVLNISQLKEIGNVRARHFCVLVTFEYSLE